MKARRTTCVSHCARCGRHFSGDVAFDLHRRGEPDERHCVSVVDEPRLTVVSEAGYCTISGDHDNRGPRTLDPVTVLGAAANRTPEKQAAYAALRRVCAEPSSVSHAASGVLV